MRLMKQVILLGLMSCALTACAGDLGSDAERAEVNAVVLHDVDLHNELLDRHERAAMTSTVEGDYAAVSWDIDFGNNTTYLQKVQGKWRILGTDYGWISFCDLKRFGIPVDKGEPLIQRLWRHGGYQVAGLVVVWQRYIPLDLKASCNRKDLF